jgi:hypothetical protein
MIFEVNEMYGVTLRQKGTFLENNNLKGKIN